MADSNSYIGKIKTKLPFVNDARNETVTEKASFMGNGGNGILSDFFGSDVYNEEEKNPHQEMSRVDEMIKNNSFVASGLSTYESIFLGEEVTVKSQDDRTQEEMNKWLNRSGLITAMGNGGPGKNYKGKGNAYYHIKRGNASGVPNDIELIANPENMWIRLNDDGSVKDYILEIDRGEQHNERNNTQAEQYLVGYGGYEKNTVYGIKYEKDEIVHVPQGSGPIPPYGRSDLASASDDEKILREIERSYAIIARHKQVPKKIFQFYQNSQNGERMPLPSKDWEEDIKPRINNLQDKDNLLLNGIEVDAQDYNYSGQSIDMMETINYLKRKITSPVLPQFLMHGDMTTNAVSNDQLAVLYQEVRGDRHDHRRAFQPILQEVAEKKNLSQDVELSFGDLELDTEQSKKKRALDMWQKGVITLDEVRDKLELPEDKQFPDGDPYKWEVQNQPSPDAVQQTLRDAVGDIDE